MIRLHKLKLTQAVALSAVINILYGAGNLLVGIREPSWWFLTLGIYYLLLCIMRLSALIANQKETLVIKTWVGSLLMLSALPLLGIVILCSIIETGTKFHEIVMIAIALYAFSKITLAIIHLIGSKKRNSESERILRSISLADAAVSIAALQRSMLVSFEGMTAPEIKIFNIATGSAVCLFVFLVGWQLVAFHKISHKK